jgi:hypothetical protein
VQKSGANVRSRLEPADSLSLACLLHTLARSEADGPLPATFSHILDHALRCPFARWCDAYPALCTVRTPFGTASWVANIRRSVGFPLSLLQELDERGKIDSSHYPNRWRSGAPGSSGSRAEPWPS